MSTEIKVPPLPESVADAILVTWHRQVGESVSRDENLVDLETDKVVLEVPAPISGKLVEIRIQDGTTVTAGEVLAIIAEGESGADTPRERAARISPRPPRRRSQVRLRQLRPNLRVAKKAVPVRTS